MRALPAQDASASERPPPPDPEEVRDPHAARPARRSAVERLAADRAKYVRGLPGTHADPASESGSPGAPAGQHCDPAAPARVPAPVARRVIARKPLRPDSLVIYRQKCEFVRGPGTDGPRGGLVKKFFQGPGKDKALEPYQTTGAGEESKAGGGEAAPIKPCQEAATAPRLPIGGPEPRAPALPSVAPPGAQAARTGVELRVARRRGLQRSQSDLSSRYSLSKAEFDTFFQYCGLDPEVIEALGKENFSAGSDHVALKVRSVSVATSDSGFSRHSDGDNDGLQEEELVEQVPSTTSVVERNARIIKWLFTCKKAKETSSQGPA
ncbi:Protein FAM110C [Sciurus carolinensis]|uniref:Protein FAM110C n=1 Tax=Sciurus carolinensis TaxID=30640 RepID=A0AA41MFL6_SCICA|nr:protein FAM110C [Sciurus carolinensis]MBZ3870954.1 Protein FAM110C [Sciurus carolinensis]